MYDALFVVRKSCADWANKSEGENIPDGLYYINPEGMLGRHFRVWCDMSTDGGGWTVFQRRTSDLERFNRNFEDYKYGFGKKISDLWLGLNKLYRMVRCEQQILRVDLKSWENHHKYAVYGTFSIGEPDGYRLSVGNYSGKYSS